jgi:hypothetical protein
VTVDVADAHAHVQRLVSVVKMETVLEKYAPRAALSCAFLWAKTLNKKIVNKEMLSVYGEKCLSRKGVRNWVQKFSRGSSKVADDVRPGRPVQIGPDTTLQKVEVLIRADRRITMDSEATALACSHGLAYSIMHCVHCGCSEK